MYEDDLVGLSSLVCSSYKDTRIICNVFAIKI